jgi:hypothetical protein
MSRRDVYSASRQSNKGFVSRVRNAFRSAVLVERQFNVLQEERIPIPSVVCRKKSIWQAIKQRVNDKSVGEKLSNGDGKGGM